MKMGPFSFVTLALLGVGWFLVIDEFLMNFTNFLDEFFSANLANFFGE